MVPDVDIDPQQVEWEIEDLWPAFLATHPALHIPRPLTRQAYHALAPAIGEWLMETQDLPAVMAHVCLESIWAVLTGLTGPAASYRFHAMMEVLDTSCSRWAAPFEKAVGYDALLFAYPDILTALQLGSDHAAVLAESADVKEALARVALWDVTDGDGAHVAVALTDVVDHLSHLSPLQVCAARWDWMRSVYAPAIVKQGYYDQAQGPVPVGEELDALEYQENAREFLNGILHGLGDDTVAQDS